MSERRMFAKTIIDSDVFLDMPLSTQALYFHLSMRADDDGFINNPKKIQRMVGGSDDDMKILIAKKFIITFDSGVIVIKHWKMHNYIQSDRYKSTVYLEEKAMLEVSENKSYKVAGNQCIQDVSILDTQVRLGKDSIELGKDSIELLDEPCGSDLLETKENLTKHRKQNNKQYSDDSDLNETILSFIKFRKDIKKPMNDHTIDLLIKKLEKMDPIIKNQIEILNQSMVNGWQGIFPLKENESKPKEKGRLDWIDDI